MDEGRHSHQLEDFLRSHLRIRFFVAVYTTFIRNLPAFSEMKPTTPGAEAALREIMNLVREMQREMSPDEFKRVYLQILVSRDIESFEYYLSEILRRVFVHKPETLRTAEQVSVREVLEAGEMNEFIKRIAEKKVIELGYESLEGIMKYLNERLGLDLDTQTKEFRAAKEYIEVRHIIAHNGGRVSELLLRRTGRIDLNVNDFFPLTAEYVSNGSSALRELARVIDTKIVSHFDLPVKRKAGST